MVFLVTDEFVRRLEAENAALRADAERYRWMRASPGLTIRAAAARTPEAFDAAIDAARKEQK